MANTKQELGFFQAAGIAAKAPLKGAAIGGIFIGELADTLWSRRDYVAETIRNTTDLVVLTAAAASHKAKEEMLGNITNVGDVENTLKEIEAHWSK